MMIDIREIWSEQESSSGKQVVRQRVDLISHLNCFIGIIGITGAKMFQLEIDNSIEIHKNYLRKFRGVEIQVLPKNESVKEYTIILLEQDLTDVFVLFIEDIIEKLHSVSDEEEALTLINQRVNYWRKLFARATGEILSAERQRGLFGELLFLHLLLSNSEDKEAALRSWHGASSANQDFIFGHNAVEVKTTKANNPSVHISNELQLDYTTWGNLYLGLVSVNESSGNQNTLYHLIQEVKELLQDNPDLLNEFEEKLDLCGIGRDEVEDYTEISYSVRNSRYFKVHDGFPIIIRDTLNNDSVFNIKYQIDIASCRSFEVSENEVLNHFL